MHIHCPVPHYSVLFTTAGVSQHEAMLRVPNWHLSGGATMAAPVPAPDCFQSVLKTPERRLLPAKIAPVRLAWLAVRAAQSEMSWTN
jgi:hypothetical protein